MITVYGRSEIGNLTEPVQEGQAGGGESQVLNQVRQTLSNGNATLLPYQALSNPTFKVRRIVIDKCRYEVGISGKILPEFLGIGDL